MSYELDLRINVPMIVFDSETQVTAVQPYQIKSLQKPKYGVL